MGRNDRGRLGDQRSHLVYVRMRGGDCQPGCFKNAMSRRGNVRQSDISNINQIATVN